MALQRMTDTQPMAQKYGRWCRKAWLLCRSLHVSGDRAAASADLGGSSNYSNENFEGRSGEGFRENSTWSRVTRS